MCQEAVWLEQGPIKVVPGTYSLSAIIIIIKDQNLLSHQDNMSV